MTLRRRTALKPSRGTEWPDDVRETARLRDGGRCLGPRVGMDDPCVGGIELDHIRVGGTGMKSRSTLDNAASLCAGHHARKTREGRTWRPLLIDLVERLGNPHDGHVDPIAGCEACFRAVAR